MLQFEVWTSLVTGKRRLVLYHVDHLPDFFWHQYRFVKDLA